MMCAIFIQRDVHATHKQSNSFGNGDAAYVLDQLYYCTVRFLVEVDLIRILCVSSKKKQKKTFKHECFLDPGFLCLTKYVQNFLQKNIMYMYKKSLS